MQGSSGVSRSTNGVEVQTSSNTTSTRWCPNASTIASAGRSHFAPLTAEEKITYRNWRRATLIARASPASYPNPPAAAPLPIGLKDFPGDRPRLIRDQTWPAALRGGCGRRWLETPAP